MAADAAEQVVTRDVRNCVLFRAASVETLPEVGQVLVGELVRAGFRPSQVPLLEAKTILTEAARVSRRPRHRRQSRGAGLCSMSAWARLRWQRE